MIIAVGSTTSSGSGTGTGSGGSRLGPPVFEWSLVPLDRIPKVITFEATSDSVFPFTIDWGDGTEEEVTRSRVVSKSYSGPFGTFEARFSSGARVAPQAIGQVDEFLSLSNIVVGDSTFEFCTAGFSQVSDIPARILTTLNDTFGFGRIPVQADIPSNIGSWDVSGVTEFRGTFFNNPFVDDSFGQWVFGDSAILGDDTFNLLDDDEVASCLIRWNSNPNQGTGVELLSTFSDSTGARAPRQLSESTYPAAKAAYDNLLSTYNWTDTDAISWVA